MANVKQNVMQTQKFGMERFVYVLQTMPNIIMFVNNAQLEALQMLQKLPAFVQMPIQSSILLNLPVRFVKPTALLMPIKMLAFVTTDTL